MTVCCREDRISQHGLVLMILTHEHVAGTRKPKFLQRVTVRLLNDCDLFDE